MDKRSVLITGGARGIGRATVEYFAENGFDVVFTYLNSVERARELEYDAAKRGYFVTGVKCNVGSDTDTAALFEFTKNKLGFIDTVINNAGTALYKLFTDTTESELMDVFETNLFGAMRIIRLYAPDMISNRFGRIINVSSMWGNSGACMESVYSASKGALDSLTKSLAREYGPSNVTVNAVAPGFIDTDMNGNLSDKEKTAFIETVPLLRAGTAREVASLIYYLASRDSGYITGEVIKAAGGL